MDMHIRVDHPLRFNVLAIPPGDYRVDLDEDRAQIVLTSSGGSLCVDAIERSSKVRVSRPSAQLRPVNGEPRLLLVVRVPPAREWIVSLDL